jgi:hypothetical protein
MAGFFGPHNFTKCHFLKRVNFVPTTKEKRKRALEEKQQKVFTWKWSEGLLSGRNKCQFE